MKENITRRQFLRVAAVGVAATAAAACGATPTPTPAPTPTPVKVEVTKIVEKPVTQIVEKPVTKVVERVITATPVPTATPKPATVRFWSWFNAPSDPLWQELLAEFQQKNPHIKVALDTVPYADMRQKVITADQAGDPPDVSRTHPSWLGEFWEADFLEPLDNYLADWKYKSDLPASTLDLARPRAGKPVLMLPLIGLLVYIMYYRQDWLKEINLPVPKTWDEWLEVAKKMTIPDKRYGFSMRGARQGWAHGWVHVLISNGVNIVDANGNVDINSDKAVELNQWWIDLYRKHKVTPPSAITDGYPQIVAHWQAQTVGMFFHGAHASADFTKAAGEAVQGAPCPRGTVKAWTRADFVGYAIWKKSKVKDAAWKLISWLLEPNQHVRIALNPLELGVPALISVGKQEAVTKNRFLKAAVESQNMWGVLPYWHPYWATMAEKDWHPAFQKALSGDMTSKQMMDLFAEGFKKAGMPKR